MVKLNKKQKLYIELEQALVTRSGLVFDETLESSPGVLNWLGAFTKILKYHNFATAEIHLKLLSLTSAQLASETLAWYRRNMSKPGLLECERILKLSKHAGTIDHAKGLPAVDLDLRARFLSPYIRFTSLKFKQSSQ